MSIGTITCIVIAVLFLILTILFAVLKERGAMWISGFNTLPKDQRKKYDKRKMSKDMRNNLFIWCALFVVGGGLSHFISQYIAFITFAVWLILFLGKFILMQRRLLENTSYKHNTSSLKDRLP